MTTKKSSTYWSFLKSFLIPLESVYAYLMIAAMQYVEPAVAGYYNVGPDEQDLFRTGDLVDMFVRLWGDGLSWVDMRDGGPHEASFLKLDSSRIKKTFGRKPRWNLERAIEKVVEWTKCYAGGGDIRACMDRQIREFFGEE